VLQTNAPLRHAGSHAIDRGASLPEGHYVPLPPREARHVERTAARSRSFSSMTRKDGLGGVSERALCVTVGGAWARCEPV
jgi:hypothetical protein